MQPLVPVGVDLRGMPFMPLDVNRLRDSQLTIHASGDEFRAAVLLWCASWNQVPAASLPNDDKSLATFAGYARDTKGWKKVREGALRGFILCDDGRLYHPVVAEKALEAWEERVEYREEKTNKDDRKKRERSWRKAAFTALRSIGITPEYNEKTSVLRALVEENGLTKAVIESQHVTPHVTPHVTVTGHTQVTAKTGTGTGTGIKDQELPPTAGSEPPNERPAILNLESPPDPIFGTGLAFLRRKGVAEKPARSFLGLLRKEAGDLTCAELLAKAESDDVTEPLAWLRAAAKSRPKPSSHASHETPDFLVGAI